MKPDSSTLCKGKCRNATARSLLAFVQKNDLEVFTNYVTDRKAWDVKYNGEYLCSASTWTAAVRKAKRVIEKGKK